MAKSNSKNSSNAKAVAESTEAPEAIVAQTVEVPEYSFATKKQLRARVRTLVRAARAQEAKSIEAIVHTKAGTFQLQLVVPSATAKYDEATYVIDGVEFHKREAYAKLIGEEAPVKKEPKAKKPAKAAQPDEDDDEDEETSADALYEEDEEEEFVS